jgi:hypothetical protein
VNTYAKRIVAGFASALLALSLWAGLGAAPASAQFGLQSFDVTFANADGSPATQAGSHPFAMTTTLAANTKNDPERGEIVDESVRDLRIAQVPGLVGDPAAVPRCPNADFTTIVSQKTACKNDSAVGAVELRIGYEQAGYTDAAVYSLEAPPGAPAKFGFLALGIFPVTFEVGLNEAPPYNLVAKLTNIPDSAQFYSAELTLWGNPASPVHDPYRGSCLATEDRTPHALVSNGICATNLREKPLLTLPRSCGGAATTSYAADSWQHSGALLPNREADLGDPNWVTGSVLTHDNSIPPQPVGFTGCGKLGFSPSISAAPTTKAAESPSGLDFSLDVADEGLTNPSEEATAQADIGRVEAVLPEGFTTNPAVAEGLAVCTEADLARETAFSDPGSGCPSASKIGTVEVETPLLEQTLPGALYVAKPYENPFGSLLALYIVIKSPQLGIVVKQPLEVVPDPVTGRLTTIADNLPQVPFSHFRLHFREGARSPLVSPPSCGSHTIEAKLTPSSGGPSVTATSSFELIAGPDGGPCPAGGTPPFKPDLLAGTLNNAAGKYSPFYVRLSRTDSEQEFSHFSIKLPPGLAGKLAGIPYCSDQAIENAKAKTGTEEELDPSCPAASYLGRTVVGAGVGSSLAYAPGKIYLAGPYHGAPISLAAITAAKVGPFDLGTVVVREAFKIDPETAEVFVDATGSDPLPRIIDGIPVHLRDVRIYVDRPEFVFNPTSCARTSTASTLLGLGSDFASEADDRPVTVSSPFQAADCAALKYRPDLQLKLKGSTKRSGNPQLTAVLHMPKGDANTAFAQVTLPHSEFLDQEHIRTICTRVQFREEKCPAGSVYGFARAVTPILDEPLQGPVYLRSSEHKLPDLVAHLQNKQVTINLVGRIDSVKGRIRNTFEVVPDAPVSTFTLEMQGGKKGLLENSTNLCRDKHRVLADFHAHNGKISETKPLLKASCKVPGKGKRKHPNH